LSADLTWPPSRRDGRHRAGPGPSTPTASGAGYLQYVAQSTEIWDVAVIGAGPAGAMAALAAASQGKRVVIVERFRIPRYKTCAGGLVGAAINALPAGFTPPVQATATSFTFCMRGSSERTKTAEVPLVKLVRRDEFDALLVDAAVAAGAVVYDNTIVTNLAAEDDAMRVTTRNRGDVRARIVVGADGSAGRSAAYVGVVLDQVDLGLEVELVTPGDRSGDWANRILIDWGAIPGAYAWVFPKGGTLSAGVIAERGNPDQTRSYLNDFLARLGLGQQEAVVSSGHLTRCRTLDSPLYRDRVLVAGDAAGLLEPWTREGISFALRSGTMAGRAAAQASAAASAATVTVVMTAYAEEISATLAPEMSAGRLFMRAFTRHPRIFYTAIILLPKAWDLVVRLILGDTSFAAITRWRLARVLLVALGSGSRPRVGNGAAPVRRPT
jgi:geranylgeranyl reductase family protein